MPEAQSQTPAEQIYYYHNDHLGTPRMVTDQAGQVVWDVDYSPFGEVSHYYTNTLPSGIDQPFRFPGQYQDTMTGLYYNWNRYYMPETGRYNRVDPLRISPNIISYLPFLINSSLNLYSYVSSNPLNYIDFSGLGRKPILQCDYQKKEKFEYTITSDSGDVMSFSWMWVTISNYECFMIYNCPEKCFKLKNIKLTNESSEYYDFPYWVSFYGSCTIYSYNKSDDCECRNCDTKYETNSNTRRIFFLLSIPRLE